MLKLLVLVLMLCGCSSFIKEDRLYNVLCVVDDYRFSDTKIQILEDSPKFIKIKNQKNRIWILPTENCLLEEIENMSKSLK